MALQSIGGVASWPGISGGGVSYADAQIMDAAGEYLAFVLVAREAMTVSHVGLAISLASGSPTADIRIETVGTDGMPTGTLWGTNTNIVTGALAAAWAVHALTAAASIAAGQVFCIKILYNSGTAFRISHVRGVQGLVLGRNLGYRVTNTGTPAKAALSLNSGEAWPIALGSSSSVFYKMWPQLLPTITGTPATFNNTNGARRGARFKVPFKCRCIGLSWNGGAEVGDYNVAVFDDAGAELSSSSTAYDGDHTFASIWHEVYFDNQVTLSPDTWYRAAVEPSSATNCAFSTVQAASADAVSAFPPNFHYTTFASAAWTDTATDTLPLLNILIDQLDDGVGGMLRHPGMGGGLNA